jgi:polyketide cyclase/dehydrase/lipid transport protein
MPPGEGSQRFWPSLFELASLRGSSLGKLSAAGRPQAVTFASTGRGRGRDLIGADWERGTDMPRIAGEIVIGRPVDVVFDYVADQSNEPQYNPRMVRAEKITAGPVGKGTQFRSAVASIGREAEMLIECTGYDRPSLLASVTTMRQADIGYTLTFEPVAAGTRMRWSGQVRPKGPWQLLGPLITWMGMRQEHRIWASLKSHLEAAPAARQEADGLPERAAGRSAGSRRTGEPA